MPPWRLDTVTMALPGSGRIITRGTSQPTCLTPTGPTSSPSFTTGNNAYQGEEMITHSVEISRRPEDVFAYLDDLERHGEWQGEIVSTKIQTEGPVRVGTEVNETRRVGKREMDSS